MTARSTPRRMRARVGGARPHAATPRTLPTPTTLKDALQQLAAGDLAVRLLVSDGQVEGATAFNAVADRMAALAASDPSGASLLDGISSAYGEGGHQQLFVAIVGLGRFGELRRQLGSGVAGEIDSVEALIRWKHPDRGIVPPDHFIGLAEETGAIADVTRWVVQKAVADHKLMSAAGQAVPIYVNLSGRLVADAEFTRWLLTQIAELPAGDLGLEITETAIISDPKHALANLQILAEAGAPIAIDDYGAGLSSLAYLKQLPATELKIDRLFVMGLTSSHRDPLLVRSTIDLAHALEMEVTAEGVENGPTLALLRTMGCDLIQGFFIARPMPLEDLQRLLGEGVQVETDFSFMQTFRRRAE